tara:strand:+ start:153 stop:611 length:459 start_codon:yes stop_codon:yes gene_type:complete
LIKHLIPTSSKNLGICYENTEFYQLCGFRPTKKKSNMSAQNINDQKLEELKKDYIDAFPKIDELRAELKILNKEQKKRSSDIQSYMQENDITELDISGISFSRVEKTSVSINMQTLSEIIEDPSELEAFKVANSTTKERLKITRPKKRSRNE